MTDSIDEEETKLGIWMAPGQDSSQTAASKSFHRLCDSEQFSQKARNRCQPKSIRKYYKNQAALLRAYQDDNDHLALFSAGLPHVKTAIADDVCTKEVVLMRASLVANLLLLIAKIAASIWSGSLSIISSTANSFVDCTANMVIVVTNWSIRNRNLYHYPRGRTRLEPLALVVIAVVMGITSVQVIIESMKQMIRKEDDPRIFLVFNDTNGTERYELDWRVAGIMISTVGVKLILGIFCCALGRHSPVIRVLAQDNLNDTLSNAAAIVCGALGQLYWVYIDSIGAILISGYVAITWIVLGCKQVAILSGRTAPPYFVSRIIKVCIDHDPEIDHVDTVAVYHFGTQFMVEVDIVVNENMTVRHAHDISGPLQRKIEHLGMVERAFVHVDFQTKHTAFDEHKSV